MRLWVDAMGRLCVGDVLVAKGGDLATSAEQPVVGVEAAGEDGVGSEVGVFLNPRLVVEPRLSLSHEGVDTVLVELLATTVVVRCPLGNPDVASADLVGFGDGVLEVISVNAVVVESADVNLKTRD